MAGRVTSYWTPEARYGAKGRALLQRAAASGQYPLSSCRESRQRSTTVSEKIRLCSSRVGLTGTPEAPPLGELSPKVTERARTLTKRNRRSDSIALPKNLLIAAWRLSGDGLALSVIAALAKAGLRLPASASLSLASCWPRPQQLLPVSAAGGGRRRCPQRERIFCAFLLEKLPEDTVYWTFILLYSCQNKKTQKDTGGKRNERH